jgi:GcrA cell cycle regulator
MSWTDERIALLKKMWKEGKSAAEIAKTLAKGVTRNAVIGKAHRMGLSGRPSPIKKPPAPKKEAAKKAPARVPTASKAPKKTATAATTKSAHIARAAEEAPKFDKEEIPEGGGVSLLELTERMCKWPIGDPREDDFTFCGRGIRVGTPYCPDHAAAAYQSSSRRSQAAAAKKQAAAEEEEEIEVVVDDDADTPDVDDDADDADVTVTA